MSSELRVDKAGAYDPGDSLVGQVCLACVEQVPVAGAAVSLTGSLGHRDTIYASDRVVAALEDLEFTLGEGPGLDAVRAHQPVLVGDVLDPRESAGGRWPAFSPAAAEAGARAVFAFPLDAGPGHFGTLLMYREQPGELSSTQRTRAVRFSRTASFAALDLVRKLAVDGAPPDGHDPDADGVFHRSQVYQASGMVMVQLGVNIEEALIRIRAHAFAAGRELAEVAHDIVERKLRLEADNG